MKLLAIDTSTKYLSVAITEDNELLASFDEREALQHFAMLIPTIDKALKKCKLELKNIDAIALSIGPGSFTGLRIGVATCKAFNLALGIHIVAVPTLDVIAYNFINEKDYRLCPLVDAKKSKVYSSLYKVTNRPLSADAAERRRLNRVTDYMLTDIDSFLEIIDKPTLVFGDGVALYGEHCRRNDFVRISTEDWYPRAEVVARLGLQKAEKRQFEDADKLVPMYMHSQYCQVRT